MPAALGEFVVYAIIIFSFAFVWCARKLLTAMFQSLIDAVNSVHIPYLGEAISGVLHSMEQACDNALGKIESGLDSLVGASWHLLAEQANFLWREFRRHALLISELTPIVSSLVNGYYLVRSLVHEAHHLYSAVAGRVRSLEREFHGIEHKVKSLEHDVTKGIGHDLRIGLKAAEKDISSIEHSALPAIRSDVAQADAAISNLYEWARGKASILGVGTFTAAVTAVLATVGLDWIACRNRNSVNGKSGCDLWNDLEGLLGAAIVTGLALDLPALIGEAQQVTPGIIDGIEKLAGIKS